MACVSAQTCSGPQNDGHRRFSLADAQGKNPEGPTEGKALTGARPLGLEEIYRTLQVTVLHRGAEFDQCLIQGVGCLCPSSCQTGTGWGKTGSGIRLAHWLPRAKYRVHAFVHNHISAAVGALNVFHIACEVPPLPMSEEKPGEQPHTTEGGSQTRGPYL